ncbi:ependymin-related protein 1-like [Mytilus galloprovincialis]|uniref:ependymin-related protein 1-like n=1 Tax=Mytilus galloprovincialis TaxID=29158 RepID=UPI003F7B899B
MVNMLSVLLGLLVFTTTPTQTSTCCLPTQMEGTLGFSSGYQVKDKGFRTEAMFLLAYDVKGKRQSTLGEGVTNGIKFQIHQIDDYAAGKQYTVTNGKCVIVPLKTEMLYCIPSDAKLLKSTFIGFDDKKIDVDMYMFTFQGATVTMSVTKDTCVPVSEHVTYPNVLVDVGYMGMTSGIKNTTVFDIPKPCQQVGFTGIPHEQNDVEHLRHRRHSPLFL